MSKITASQAVEVVQVDKLAGSRPRSCLLLEWRLWQDCHPMIRQRFWRGTGQDPGRSRLFNEPFYTCAFIWLVLGTVPRESVRQAEQSALESHDLTLHLGVKIFIHQDKPMESLHSR